MTNVCKLILGALAILLSACSNGPGSAPARSITRPALDNLKTLKIACLETNTTACIGHYGSQMEKLIQPMIPSSDSV